ncbi:MAG: metallophosphoesterase, partial [Oscillospiraceae bacterium]|nr:metallophosphoesterase [Oscillospiraceae bacterium]
MNRYKLGRKTKRGLAFLLSLVIAIGVLTPMLDTTASAAYVEFEELQVHQTSAPLSGSNYRNLSLNPGALNTEMRFTWHSGSPTGSIIIANPGGADWVLESTGRLAEAHAGIGIMGDTSYLLPTRPGFVYYVHQVSVYNLAPNTQYNYVVTWEGGQSGSKSFRTGGNDNFSFIIAGDPQIGTGDGLAPTSAMVEAAVDGAEWASAISIADAHAENAEFILSVGDQVHTAGGGPADFRHVRISQYRHDRMFSPSELQRLPLMAVVGNHDGWSFDDNNANPRLWPMHYNIPAPDAIGAFDQNNGGVPTVFRHATRFYTQFDYWVVWGNTLFLVLDSNVRTMSGGRLDFLNAAVVANEDNVDWIVAVYHHPAYCVYRARNIAEKNEVVANWIPHFERLGVDIVLNGHAHVYNRTFHMLNNAPIKDQYWLNAAGEVQEDETGLLYNAVLDPEGIVYFVFNSASGSGYYNVSNMPRSYIAAYNQNFRRNFSVADVTPDMFSIRTYQINDNGPPSLVDVYTIVRSDDGAVPSSVLPLPQMTEQVFERFTQPDDLENVLHPGDVIVTAEMLGLPDTIGVETNLFNNVGGNIGNIRPPNAQAAPTSYGTVVRTPRAYVKWDVEDSDFDPNDIDAQEFYVRGYIHELPDGISVPAELLPYRIYIGVSVLPYGVRPVGDIARWMQYPPGHTNHPLGMEAYFASHGVSGLNVRRPQVYRTGGEAEPLQFWANNEQRMFNWEAGAPNVTQNLVSGGGVGSSGSGLHNVTGEAYWVTRVSTEGQAGVEVQFNMRSDATGPRDWQLQFSIDGDNWADAGDPVILSGFWDNNIIRVLPAAADDQQNLYIRWIMTSNTAPNGGAIVAAGRHHMRDIIIRSTVMPGGELPGDDEHTRIDILMFNDFHGHISHGRPDDNNPGAARLSAYIQYLRQQNPTSPDNVIVVAGGDDFHGYAVSTLLGGAPTITMMEELANNSPNQDYFQVAFGNHELSFGLARAMEIGTDYGIELLAADLVYGVGHPTGTTGERPDFIRPYSIISFDNDGEEISIALVGLMTSTMGTVVGGWDSMNFHARTPAPGAPNLYTQIIADLIEHIRDYYGVATVVGLTHKPAEAPSMLYIARELDFDAIFGAHRHARVQHVYAGVPIIEAASHGRALGRFSLNFNDQGELVNVVPWISPVNAIRDFSRDRAEMAGVEEYYDRMTDLMEYYTTNPEVSSYLNDPRGPIGIYFDTRANRDMWSSRLVLDYVVRWAEEHDDELDWIGVSNSGGWRNTGQWPRNASDNVNYADLLSTMPFDNNLLLFEMH